MSDYERIAAVIRYLDQHHAEQPSLETLAARTGLSPFHFHRLFTDWAGVTPKDFVQSLTLEHARRRLREGASVLETALEGGLSGPSRLHDLCLSLEAASPGEIKSGGTGWRVRFGFGSTPFGEAIIAEGPRGICYLAFLGEETPGTAEAGLRTAWPGASLQVETAWATETLATIFRRKPGWNRLRGVVRGSKFQVRVWTALLRVPAGSLTTYKQLAAGIGQPAAARAVGSAVGANLLAYLIPCHRVIRETGVLGGYRWGLTRKQAILAWEEGLALTR